MNREAPGDTSAPAAVEPVREAPFPEPIFDEDDDPSFPDASKEPVLHVGNIQGNILGGFNKDHQAFVFLTLKRNDHPGATADQEFPTVKAFKAWLRETIPLIATTAEVVAFNRLFKAMRSRQQQDPIGLKSTWINLAFTARGLEVLKKFDPTLDLNFTDPAFTQGMASRSKQGILGDPSGDDQKTAEGHPDNWVLGGTQEELHLVVIIASDDAGEVKEKQGSALFRLLRGEGGRPGLRDFGKVKVQLGHNLPAKKKLAGHEHFGFLDGISQPGVRGRLTSDPHDVLTPRQNPKNREQGKPGSELIWPGEFVFGYEGGLPNTDGVKTFEDPGPVAKAGPDWADDGAYLLIRRLRQNVGLFHKFLKQVAQTFQVPTPPPQTVTPPPGVPVGDSAADLVGSRFVGRWRSGAPIRRTRNPDPTKNDRDNPSMAIDDSANNNFEYQEDSPALLPSDPHGPFDSTDEDPRHPGTLFPPALADTPGRNCPFTAHIRKVYPRDDESTSVPPNIPPTLLNETTTQTHRMLRRGIPYGPASDSTPNNPKPDSHDRRPSRTGGLEDGRGLIFVAYETSLVDQFEFVTRAWVNNPNFKESSQPPDATQPGGHDPIIGQNNNPNAQGARDRIREFNLTFVDNQGNPKLQRVSTNMMDPAERDWVIPTGGEFFFAPSISALEMLAK
ncbi:Dyp-type peroxidase [Vitiosangium sp. GDMCC 1.1324]|uniref:Dyp-type peroxidase n=1 Tax=Vitiosangium sp. (strain GDMCC 1.1324) TaxID=2138576 RepID=UPI00130DE99F|nr:Dyp-type peroxidase [Vitiosangium sp. GDMCC 1.1324]